MKKALVIALVIVVVFTGIPVVTGMPMVDCADCDQGFMTSSLCFGVLASLVALFLAAHALRLPPTGQQLRQRLAPFTLERPPRLA